MREKMKLDVSGPVRVGVSIVAAILLTPILVGVLAPLALVLAPFAALALPFVVVGLRGDATGKPSIREVLARPFPIPVRQLKTISVRSGSVGLEAPEPA